MRGKGYSCGFPLQASIHSFVLGFGFVSQEYFSLGRTCHKGNGFAFLVNRFLINGELMLGEFRGGHLNLRMILLCIEVEKKDGKISFYLL